jgi:hypothetical protein
VIFSIEAARKSGNLLYSSIWWAGGKEEEEELFVSRRSSIFCNITQFERVCVRERERERERRKRTLEAVRQEGREGGRDTGKSEMIHTM